MTSCVYSEIAVFRNKHEFSTQILQKKLVLIFTEEPVKRKSLIWHKNLDLHLHL